MTQARSPAAPRRRSPRRAWRAPHRRGRSARPRTATSCTRGGVAG